MNALYAKGRQKFLEGEIHWLSDTIKAQMIDTADYTVNLDTHESLSDIPSAARVGAPQTLSGKTSTGAWPTTPPSRPSAGTAWRLWSFTNRALQKAPRL
jgi:hypothetical protein